MMGQVLERAHSPLITPNATTSTSASASWNRLEWRRVVLAVSTALAVPLVVSTCCAPSIVNFFISDVNILKFQSNYLEDNF